MAKNHSFLLIPLLPPSPLFSPFNSPPPLLRDELILIALMKLWNINTETLALEMLNNPVDSFRLNNEDFITHIEAKNLSTTLYIYPLLKTDARKPKTEWDAIAALATQTALKSVDNILLKWKNKDNRDSISTNGHGDVILLFYFHIIIA